MSKKKNPEPKEVKQEQPQGEFFPDNMLRAVNAINKASMACNDQYEKLFKKLAQCVQENEKLKKNQADNIKIINEKDEIIKDLKTQLAELKKKKK